MKVHVLQEGSRPNEIGYHFTNIKNLSDILYSDKLWATNTEDNPPTWSYTRARKGMYYRHLKGLDFVRISFDIDKISNNYKVRPYSWETVRKNNSSFEYEERVSGKPLIDDEGKPVLDDRSDRQRYGLDNVTKYITEITLNAGLEKTLFDKPYYKLNSKIQNQFDSVMSHIDYAVMYSRCFELISRITDLNNSIESSGSSCLLDGSSEDICAWLKKEFKSIASDCVPIKLLKKIDDFIYDELPWRFSRIRDLYSDMDFFVKNYKKSLTYLDSARSKFADLQSGYSSNLFVKVPDEEREEQASQVSYLFSFFHKLQLKDGTSVTTYELLNKYLQERNIRLNFLEGSDINYVYEEEKKLGEKKFKLDLEDLADTIKKVEKNIEDQISSGTVTSFYSDCEKRLNQANYSSDTFLPSENVKDGINLFLSETLPECLVKLFKSYGITESTKMYLMEGIPKEDAFAFDACSLYATNETDIQSYVEPLLVKKSISNKKLKSFLTSCKFTKARPWAYPITVISGLMKLCQNLTRKDIPVHKAMAVRLVFDDFSDLYLRIGVHSMPFYDYYYGFLEPVKLSLNRRIIRINS